MIVIYLKVAMIEAIRLLAQLLKCLVDCHQHIHPRAFFIPVMVEVDCGLEYSFRVPWRIKEHLVLNLFEKDLF